MEVRLEGIGVQPTSVDLQRAAHKTNRARRVGPNKSGQNRAGQSRVRYMTWLALLHG